MIRSCGLTVGLLTLCSAAGPASHGSALARIATRGAQWVDEQGSPVVLRGCNVGNWLIQEMWMHAMRTEGIPDQYTLEQVLAERFGRAGKDRLMEIYHSHFITARDFAIIKSFGMNVVRLPFVHWLIEDEARPGQLRPGAWRHLDRALELAEQAGLYVILDLHGAPGGQNWWHHSGREGRNALWGSDENKRRTVWLWREIASRYRGRTVVAGYGLLNEPYHAPKEELRELMLDIYRAIREVDAHTVVIFPSMPDGVEFYGRPADLGLHKVAFDAHFYPGLFGWGEPTRETHVEWLTTGVNEWRARFEAAGVPVLVGEMNVVFRAAGGAEVMRHSFDTYTGLGWAVTMWSYKVLGREGGIGDAHWGMVTNPPAPEPGVAPGTEISPNTSSFEEIEAYFRSLSTMEYAIHEELRDWLTRPEPPPPLR